MSGFRTEAERQERLATLNQELEAAFATGRPSAGLEAQIAEASTAPLLRWAAGWNMPGYLPEDEPMACATWESARHALLLDVERADEGAWGATSDQLDTAQAELRAAPEGQAFHVACGAYVLFVQEA